MAVATDEPKTFIAGNNVYWNKSLSDYPASTYALKYTLTPISGGEAKEFMAIASGNTHQMRLNPAQTIAINPGDYLLVATVTDIATSGTTTKQTIVSNRITVKPAPESEIDRRTFAEAILDDLQHTYKKLAQNSISSATVNGKTYTRNTLSELRSEIIYYKNEIRNERGGATKRIAVSFSRPT